MTYIPNGAYDSAIEANRSYEVYPLSAQIVSEQITPVVNGTDATYYYYYDMDGYRKAGFQISLDCAAGTVTATIEGTLWDNGTADASCDYIDITSDSFGVASLVATAAAAEAMWIDNAEALALYKYVRVKIVAATGGNTGDWSIYHRRLY